MKTTWQFGCLIVGLVGLVSGCTETPSSDQYHVISKADATQSQQSLEQTVESDPMSEPAQESEPPKSPDSGPTLTVASTEKAATSNTKAAESDAGAKEPKLADGNEATDKPKPAPKLLVTEKQFTTTEPENSLRLTFEDIDLEKIFEVKEATKELPQYFPSWLKELDGRRVRIRGYMVPTFQAEDLVGFVLARDTSACCFGPNPKVSYLIEVSMKKGKTSDYIHYRPFDVVGTLHVGDEVSPGRLYQIDDAVVIRK